MPLYDLKCDACGNTTEHLVKNTEAADTLAGACTVDDCGGTTSRALNGFVYKQSIEMYMESERGHLSTFQPPPVRHSKSGAGIRKYPMPQS